MRRRLFFKNLVILFLVIMIPILVVYSITLQYSQNAIREKAITEASSDLELVSQYMDSTLNNFYAVGRQISSNTSLLNWLKDLDSLPNVYSKIYPMFNRWSQYADILINNHAESVFLYMDGSPFVLTDNGLQQIKTLYDTNWLNLYQEIRESLSEHSYILASRQTRKGYTLASFLLPIKGVSDKCEGILVIDLERHFLQKIVNRSSYKNADFFMISETGNTLFASTQDSQLQTSVDNSLFFSDPSDPAVLSGDKREHIFLHHTSDNFSWHAYLYIRSDILFSDLLEIKRLSPILLATVLILATGFALFYTYQNFKPVLTMMNIIETYNKSGTVVEPKSSHSDVYNHLIYSLINTLVDKNNLKLRVALLESSERESRMRALQSNINPHFLYNVLDVANWSAVRSLGPSNDVSHMLKALADTFRSIFDDPRLTVSMEDELGLLDHYIQLLKYVDYRNLSITQDIASDTYNLEIPRLIIQPLIENAYIHGLSAAKNPRIHLLARQRNGNLELLVTDNGAGLESEKLTSLNQSMRHQTPTETRSSGLQNVNNRLILRYGEEYCITLFSQKGHGTCVRIRIPLDKKHELIPEQKELM